MQVHDDIRYFYNKAGLPMDIKGIVAGFDCFEVDATAFANGTLPTNSQIGQFCGVATGGKFTAPASSVASGATFRVEGLHTLAAAAAAITMRFWPPAPKAKLSSPGRRGFASRKATGF